MSSELGKRSLDEEDPAAGDAKRAALAVPGPEIQGGQAAPSAAPSASDEYLDVSGLNTAPDDGEGESGADVPSDSSTGAAPTPAAPLNESSVAATPPAPSAFKLFVGGIHAQALTPEVRAHFEQFGRVADCKVMLDHLTQRSRGFAFLTMADQAGFDSVLAHKEAHTIMDKWMEVKPCDSGPPSRAAPNPALPAGASKNLHVSNLGAGVGSAELKQLFGAHVAVREVFMKETFAFVNTESAEGASAAMAALQGREVGCGVGERRKTY